ncbi:MAG: rod shape-determining protein MreD [Alphaproteobacteria bacterium]|jgi:rod shape-determining protein MreD|nr:rod shape-determining protein MreD [Alphaproteobacteria bacterium]
MTPAGWVERTDFTARSLLPFATVLLLVVASVVPWHLPGLAPVTPAFSLMAVYYWAIYRPDKLPYAATFAAGLLQDFLSGGPLGMTALVLLCVHGVVGSQRTFFHGKPFRVVWWGFSLVAPGAAAMSWVVASAYYGLLVPPLPLIVYVVLTVLLYPLLGFVFTKLHNGILARV